MEDDTLVYACVVGLTLCWTLVVNLAYRNRARDGHDWALVGSSDGVDMPHVGNGQTKSRAMPSHVVPPDDQVYEPQTDDTLSTSSPSINQTEAWEDEVHFHYKRLRNWRAIANAIVFGLWAWVLRNHVPWMILGLCVVGGIAEGRLFATVFESLERAYARVRRQAEWAPNAITSAMALVVIQCFLIASFFLIVVVAGWNDLPPLLMWGILWPAADLGLVVQGYISCGDETTTRFVKWTLRLIEAMGMGAMCWSTGRVVLLVNGTG